MCLIIPLTPKPFHTQCYTCICTQIMTKVYAIKNTRHVVDLKQRLGGSPFKYQPCEQRAIGTNACAAYIPLYNKPMPTAYNGTATQGSGPISSSICKLQWSSRRHWLRILSATSSAPVLDAWVSALPL